MDGINKQKSITAAHLGFWPETGPQSQYTMTITQLIDPPFSNITFEAVSYTKTASEANASDLNGGLKASTAPRSLSVDG